MLCLIIDFGQESFFKLTKFITHLFTLHSSMPLYILHTWGNPAGPWSVAVPITYRPTLEERYHLFLTIWPFFMRIPRQRERVLRTGNIFLLRRQYGYTLSVSAPLFLGIEQISIYETDSREPNDSTNIYML